MSKIPLRLPGALQDIIHTPIPDQHTLTHRLPIWVSHLTHHVSVVVLIFMKVFIRPLFMQMKIKVIVISYKIPYFVFCHIRFCI